MSNEKRHRQSTYIDNMKKKGFVYVGVWVPKELSMKIRSAAEKMRRKSGHSTPRAKKIYSKRKPS